MCARKSAAPSPSPSTLPEDDTVSLLRQVVRALDDKKATDLRVLQVREQSSITDYLVLATGNAHPHLRALRVELEKVIDAAHAKIGGMELGNESGWLVVDAYQIMVHLFLPEQREHYRLEQLWRDAVELSVAELLAPSEKPAKPAKKRVVKKAAAKKTTAKTTATKKAPAKKAAVKKASVKKPAAKKAAKKRK